MWRGQGCVSLGLSTWHLFSGYLFHVVQKKLTEKIMRTIMSCVKQNATPNLNEAKAETMVALPSLKAEVNYVNR